MPVSIDVSTQPVTRPVSMGRDKPGHADAPLLDLHA